MNKLKPTAKAKALIKAIALDSTNLKHKPLKELMLNSGYSKSTANSPNSVVNKPSFQSLLEKAGLTDKALTDTAKEGLTALKPIEYKGIIMSEYPDYKVRHSYLETALKLKGHLNTNNQVNIQANDYKLIIEDIS